ASQAFQNLFTNPAAAIIAGTALVALAGVVRGMLKKGIGGGGGSGGSFEGGGRGAIRGMATGGYVTQGGVFQLHKDELVALPRGAAVTPAHMVTGAGGAGDGTIQVEGFIDGYGLSIVTKKYNYKSGRIG